MKIKELWGKVPLKSYIYSSLGITLAVSLFAILVKGVLPPEVPLFYGKPVGEEQLASSLGLVIAPGVSLLVTLVNTILSAFVEDPFLKKALVISAFFVSLLTAITIFKIIFLVGFF